MSVSPHLRANAQGHSSVHFQLSYQQAKFTIDLLGTFLFIYFFTVAYPAVGF